MNSQRVVIAMSGGVDSSVAAALLVQQGFEVIGMMLRLWSEPGKEANNRCCSPDAIALARRTAAKLGFPFYVIDAQEVFHQKVVGYFIQGYMQGATPNPCLECNRSVRWEFLLNRAQALGADFLATGHYARLHIDPQGSIQLLKAVDSKKDQSYVLHVLNQDKLSHALFPLGEYTKPQVRQLARDFELGAADRPESQDLCFLGDSDYRTFLLRNAPHARNPGSILSRNGEQLGEHQGLAFYTIGQRKGLGIFAANPLYVLEKDLSRNALIVGTRDELGGRSLIAVGINWVGGIAPQASFRAQVKIRYTVQEATGMVTPVGEGTVRIDFDDLVRDITPGQAAVFYNKEICLGGGIIASSI